MSTAKMDPLEAAKIGTDQPKPTAAPTPPQKPAAQPPQKPAAQPPKAAVPARPRAPDPDPLDELDDAAPAAPAPHKRYRVVREHKLSLGGMMCTLKPGTVVDAAGYGGEPGIAKLRAQGLELEELVA